MLRRFCGRFHSISRSSTESMKQPAPFYALEATDIDGKIVSMADFQDRKVILVVNVASECGLTVRNYTALQALYDKYHSKGFTVLAFPCNQFGNQEPNSDAEIKAHVQTTFHVQFPLFSKINVNGSNAHPIYKYLKSTLRNPAFGIRGIVWNFEKFLLVDGYPIKRYSFRTMPESIEADIVSHLNSVQEE